MRQESPHSSTLALIWNEERLGHVPELFCHGMAPLRFINTFAPLISSDGKTLSLEATSPDTCKAICITIPAKDIPYIYSSQEWDNFKANRAAHDKWLTQQRVGMLEDRTVCKPAVAVPPHGKTVLEARCAVLRPDGVPPNKARMLALLINAYYEHCSSDVPGTLLGRWREVREIEDAAKTGVWRWLGLQLSKQIFVTDGGDVGSVLNGSEVASNVCDEV